MTVAPASLMSPQRRTLPVAITVSAGAGSPNANWNGNVITSGTTYRDDAAFRRSPPSRCLPERCSRA